MNIGNRGFVGFLGLLLALALAGAVMYVSFKRYARQESLPAGLRDELPGISAAPGQALSTVDVMKKKLADASKVLEEKAAAIDQQFR